MINVKLQLFLNLILALAPRALLADCPDESCEKIDSDGSNFLQMDLRELRGLRREEQDLAELRRRLLGESNHAASPVAWEPSASAARTSSSGLVNEDAQALGNVGQNDLNLRLRTLSSELHPTTQGRSPSESESAANLLNVAEHGLSSMTSSSSEAVHKKLMIAEEENALAAQAQLRTHLDNAEHQLRAAQDAELKKASQEEAMAESLAQTANEVRASQKSVSTQMSYSSRMSDFLQDAAKEAQDAHVLEHSLEKREQKASLYLEQALQQMYAASNAAKDPEERQRLERALRETLKAQAEVISVTQQQEQATYNINAALHSAAQAAVASEAFSTKEINPALENISNTIEVLQSTASRSATADTEVAQVMQGTERDFAQAKQAVQQMRDSFAELNKEKDRAVQQMVADQHAMHKEAERIAEKGQQVAHMLNQAKQLIADDELRAGLKLRSATEDKAQAMNMLEASAQSQDWLDKEIHDNIQSLANVGKKAAYTADSLRLNENPHLHQGHAFGDLQTDEKDIFRALRDDPSVKSAALRDALGLTR